MPTKFIIEGKWPKSGPKADEKRRPLTVILRDPTKSSRYESETRWSTEFTLKIPDFMWNQLVGKIIPQKKKGDYGMDVATFGLTVQTFPKTLADGTLYGLLTKWETLIEQYEWSVLLDKYPLERVIFYSLTGSIGEFAYGGWHHSDACGEHSKCELVYATGYRTRIPAMKSEYRQYEDEFRYDVNRKIIRSYQNEAFYDLKWVRWTEERERFFDHLRARFHALTARMKEFEGEIAEEKLDALIATKYPQLKA